MGNDLSLPLAKQIASPPVHLWSGGPRAHNRGGGWADYDYSRVDFDTAAPYFKRLSNTRFQALQSGYFSYKVDSMIHCNGRCQKHFRFYCNNQLINGNSHYYSYSWYVVSRAATHLSMRIDYCSWLCCMETPVWCKIVLSFLALLAAVFTCNSSACAFAMQPRQEPSRVRDHVVHQEGGAVLWQSLRGWLRERI